MTVTTAGGFEIPDYQSISDVKTFVSQAHSHGSQAVVTVGGYSGGIYFSSLVSNATSRANFVSQISSFLTLYNFDGVDLDWENMDSNKKSSKDIANFLVSRSLPCPPLARNKLNPSSYRHSSSSRRCGPRSVPSSSRRPCRST